MIRGLLIDSELIEDVKWGMPTYTLNSKNVISFSGFKNHFGIWFHQGVFLSDKHQVLINAQEGKTKGMRHIKFFTNKEVNPELIALYIYEAIQNQKEGKEVKVERNTKVNSISQFMLKNLSEDLIKKLNSFSPGRRNEFIKYITVAKRESTKLSRIEKIKPMLEAGKSLNHMYERKK